MEKAENAASRITKEQIERLVQIMEKNPDAAKGVCNNPTAFWGEVSLELNSLGPSKDKLMWKKTWIDKKSNVKKKFCQIRSEQKKTGGGIPLPIKLNDIEERILNVTNIRANVEGATDTICIGTPVCSNEEQEKTNVDPCVSPRPTEPTYTTEELDQEAISSKPATSSKAATSSKPATSSLQQHQRKQPNQKQPDIYQQTLVEQNESIANSLAEMVSMMKIFVESTIHFQKELLECVKQNNKD